MTQHAIAQSRLVLHRLTKSFPAVIACNAVDLDVASGEIHALLGENGAGKSTLVKMIYGALEPDSGTMTFEGAPFRPRSPAEARAQGVGMVFQHFSLFDALTVVENIALGIAPELADGDLTQRVMTVADEYGLALEPDRLVGTLSVGERQRIEIVRCLLQNPKLIIMDEPTSVLTPAEVERLFHTLRRLAGEGRSILYISHKLEEIRALCSRATILRGGKRIATSDPRMETAKSLAEMMIGTTLSAPKRNAATPGPALLELDQLSLNRSSTFGVALDRVTLTVRAGEIVGIAGVAGNGQSELVAALIGEELTADPQMMRIAGEACGDQGPNARRSLGLAVVPEERLGHGAVPDMSLAANVLLSAGPLSGLFKRGFIDAGARDTYAQKIIAAFGVKTPSFDRAARSLSGGNLQKFIMGREILHAPKVFVAAQPTWGVDAGAAQLIHERLIALAEAGTAVLLISQDLDELFALADRIAVLSTGTLSDARPVGTLTVETIGLEMGQARRATSTSASEAA
jgi:general nucleoside transport system ATP-binding protein